MANSAVLGAERRVGASADLRPRTPRGLLLRVRTRLRRPWLDAEIARGVERPGDLGLALRKAQLVGAHERRRLASRFEDVLAPRTRPAGACCVAPFDVEAVEVAEAVLAEIILRLRSSDAVEARGVALGWRLFTDPCSPIYTPPGERSGDLNRLWYESLSVLSALRQDSHRG
jgi:hypothetical protein